MISLSGKTFTSVRGRIVIKNVAIIGCGNVGCNLSKSLSRCVNVRQVYSRNLTNAIAVAKDIEGCEAIDDLNRLLPGLDCYLLAVKDDAIKEVVGKTASLHDGIWAHTSGSVNIDILQSKQKYGVFYPLQTFSKGKAVDMKAVPFFIEGSNDSTREDLIRLAGKMSDMVHIAGSEERKQLHIAAVYACNFVDLMWIYADKVLNRMGLDISVLAPLIKETQQKIEELRPVDALTGPASRGDKQVVDSHMSMLDGSAKEVYEILSKIILQKKYE